MKNPIDNTKFSLSVIAAFLAVCCAFFYGLIGPDTEKSEPSPTFIAAYPTHASIPIGCSRAEAEQRYMGENQVVKELKNDFFGRRLPFGWKIVIYTDYGADDCSFLTFYKDVCQGIGYYDGSRYGEPIVDLLEQHKAIVYEKGDPSTFERYFNADKTSVVQAGLALPSHITADPVATVGATGEDTRSFIYMFWLKRNRSGLGCGDPVGDIGFRLLTNQSRPWELRDLSSL